MFWAGFINCGRNAVKIKIAFGFPMATKNSCLVSSIRFLRGVFATSDSMLSALHNLNAMNIKYPAPRIFVAWNINSEVSNMAARPVAEIAIIMVKARSLPSPAQHEAQKP